MTEYHQIVNEFVDSHRHTKEEGTQTGYRHAAQHFVSWLDVSDQVAKTDLEDVELTKERVTDWLNDLLDHYPESTVKTRFYNASSFFEWLVDNDVLQSNPTSDISISDYVDRGYSRTAEVMRAKEGIIYLEEDEMEQLVAHVPEPVTRNELMVRLLLQTGLRPSELTSIRIPDIDREERQISVVTAKTGKIRDVWYQPSLDMLMNRWLDADRAAMPTASETNYAFITRYSAPMYTGRPSRVVDSAAENAEIQEIMFTAADGSKQRKITAKTLRHTFAVQSVKAGMDVRSLQLLMGHEKLSTTEQYLRFSDETLKQKMIRHGPDP